MKRNDDKKADEHKDELPKLAASLMRKPAKGSSVDDMSLKSRRRAIAYGRARGNA